MEDAVLVFDIGTTNFKTCLFDQAGETLLVHSEPFRPAYGLEGMVYQEPDDWRNAVVAGARLASAFARDKGRAIACVSLTASRSSVIPVDREGAHIAPAMMWQETASRDIVNRFNQGETLGRIHRCTGSRPNTVYSAPKMTWLRRHRPDIYAKAHKLVGIQDYVIRFLTGAFVTDHTFGSRTLLMDIRARQWDGEMLDLFEVDGDKLCRLIEPGSVAGTVTPAAAALTGLPSGLPVVTAGGDQNNAALGAGVTRRGDVLVNMGTGSFMVAAADEPVIDPGMRVMCNASAIPGKWIMDAGMLATGSVHRWFVETFYADMPLARLEDKYARAEAEAAAAAPGGGGLFILPHFSGRGAPHWDNRAKGVVYGLGLEHSRKDLARAVFEGIAGEIAATLAVAAELNGGIAAVRLAGGLSQSPFFNQLLADVSRRALLLSHSREATARGAWSQAMAAMGLVREPDEALARGVRNGEEDVFRPQPCLAGIYDEFLHRRERLFAGLAAAREGI